LSQRTQLADHLFSRIILKHAQKDAVRERAFIGLIRLNLDQLHDYPRAVKLTEQLQQEFVDLHNRSKVNRDLLFEVAGVARQQLSEPDRAESILIFTKDRKDLTARESLEISETFLASRNFDTAIESFQQAFSLALAEKNCALAREIQAEIMHALALAKKCGQSVEWGEKELFEGCSPNLYSVRIELAYCYEREGAPEKALSLYEQMLKEEPVNARVLFLQSQLKTRQKEKGMK